MERIKQFFAAPTYWQRLALLSLLSMFISHIILLSSQNSSPEGGVDVFAIIAGAVILLFVIGWSALNGASDTRFISRTIGTVCASFEIHRLVYSYIWPEKLKELQEPTFYVFSIILIVALLIQSLSGKTASDFFAMVQNKKFKGFKIDFPKLLKKTNVAFSKPKKSDDQSAP